MRRFLAARVGSAAACWLLVCSMLVRSAGAQTWNDPRSRSLVEGATQRRAEQLADTALRDYTATAHGYVTLLAQLGEGFRTPPKVIKADELVDEVYWRAPNLSKQRIVGRRDTLLLPTDIAYHSDHLGIVQNNFPNVIRIGDGDEVADVPHPLSPLGLNEYDFALTDSFAIGSGASRIHVYEVKVRPKDDTKPRVIGAVYIEPESRQVVRMNFTFTAAAFLDKALDELSIVLENRLVGGRFWLPSQQKIEIARVAEWLDYPARGIIQGRWEIGDYRFNQSLAPMMFAGPEYVQAPPNVLAQYKWAGSILDSLPADVRTVTDADIERVQSEARALVRARALQRSQHAVLSARNVSDFARFDRVEGLAVGNGVGQQLGKGFAATARARYGLDDKMLKGSVDLAALAGNGGGAHLFASRDFRDVGDVQERSSIVNTLAAQEFGSDYTDPYLVRAVGARLDFASVGGFDTRITGSYERQSPVGVHAVPVTGTFEPTTVVNDQRATRVAIDLTRPSTAWVLGSELTLRAQVRARWPLSATLPNFVTDADTYRGFIAADVVRPFGSSQLLLSGTAAGVAAGSSNTVIPNTERAYLGGPVSAPGYDFHSLVANDGLTGHLEWRMPAPFPAFSLGRYGRVPARGTFAPYAHVALLEGNQPTIVVPGQFTSLPALLTPAHGAYASLGAAYILPFDLLRLDVAKGVGLGGRWTFYLDVSREFWSIL